MPRVLAVNNYPTRERFERLARSLKEAGASVATAEWKDASRARFGSFDGVVLSGSPDMLSKPTTREKYRAEMEAVVEAGVPTLGICFGHQLVGTAYGAEVVRDRQHVLKFVKTSMLAEDPLLAGLPEPSMLLESREEVVGSLPQGFGLLAESETSEIAGMKHLRLPVYGVQSHPERYTAANPEGLRLLANFVGLL